MDIRQDEKDINILDLKNQKVERLSIFSPIVLTACVGDVGPIAKPSSFLSNTSADQQLPALSEAVETNSYLASFGLQDAQSMLYTTTGMEGGPGQKAFDEAIVQPVDVLFMQYDSWNSLDRVTEIRSGSTISQLKMGSGNEKLLIANKSFGEISPIRGDLLGTEIEMSWLNTDGLKNHNAPSWFAFPNTDWVEENPPDLGRYQNWSYLGKHPLYLVEFWDDEYLDLNKDFISDLAEAGWNGIFLDTILSPLWKVGNQFFNKPYTNEELAEFTFYALSELRGFIDQSFPGFQLSINASGITQEILFLKPEILELLDGIVVEVPFFYNEDKEYINFPAVFSFADQTEDMSSFYQLTDLISEMENGPALHIVETVENDSAIFDYIAREFFELKGTATIRYDSRHRENDTGEEWDPNNFTILPHFHTLVDITSTNEIINETNMGALLVGLEGDDQLTGSDFDDIFIGGPGNDYLFGGDGYDKAIFKGSISQYNITLDNQGTVTVETIDYNVVNSNDGKDDLREIEILSFLDQEIIIDEFFI